MDKNMNEKTHVCPWWMGYFLLNPFRKIGQNPKKILAPYVDLGMTILEVGPGMGFFTLPLAEMVGPAGKIVCVDIQEKMLNKLAKRAEKAKLHDRIEARVCGPDGLRISDLGEKVDFVLLYAVVHEIPNKEHFFSEIFRSLKGDGTVLFSEPKMQANQTDFDKTLKIAEASGLSAKERIKIWGSHSAILIRK
jgi:ubiquinone/menaquinone biosynthesis C-methylase UbiE